MKRRPGKEKAPAPSASAGGGAGLRFPAGLPRLTLPFFAAAIAGAALFYWPIFAKLGARALCYADWAGFCDALAQPLPGGALAWASHALARSWALPVPGLLTWLLLAAGVALLGRKWAKVPAAVAFLPAAVGVWQVAYCGFSAWIFVNSAFPYLNLTGWGLWFLLLGAERRRALGSLAGLLLYPLCGTPLLIALLGCAVDGRKAFWKRALLFAAALLPPILWKFGTWADPAWRPLLLANAPFLFEEGSLLWDLLLAAALLAVAFAPALAALAARLPGAVRIAAAAALTPLFLLSLYLGMDAVRPLYDVLACERALAREDYRAILDIPAERAAAHRMLGAYRICALWRTGRLAEELFEVPWTVSHESSTIDTMELDGYQLLYEYGIVQMARRWAYESVINKGWTVDKYLLMARVALILNEPEMARRYALQLARIPFASAAADEIFAFLEGGAAPANLARIGDIHYRLARDPGAPVFEGDKRLEPGIYNRYAVMKNGNREMVTLYLCSALLRKDILPFLENYPVICSVWTERPLPAVFQQALLAAAATQPPDAQIPLTADLFSPGVPQAFSDFQRLMRRAASGPPSDEVLARFRQTYWFYATFVP